jgi:hypothetical protein
VFGARLEGATVITLFRERKLRTEAPVEQVAGIERDAEEIGRHEAELRGAHADDADDGAVDGSDDPALPEFAAQEDRAEDGQNARDVIQTNAVE